MNQLGFKMAQNQITRTFTYNSKLTFTSNNSDETQIWKINKKLYKNQIIIIELLIGVPFIFDHKLS